ncbi:hypothetical protein A2851_05260 [Candidatus Kaiserbacteria bacterium RIFCSPHIGHO2_01_FULL_53_29]|uniref:Uncharacterized protein n=1 Tax=Candidatus Kaiserbacteria bacterium RIFCSPHIGHO2_01_FULL_53_29 TaxID=1798480 RepID=A0A1F6CTE1_9BACT|nr:MAG: hypothetical protein A2851_05260 [Candidatus Kaiserbacteria bacterium RIFCSPHIGHO2_01_FULL_53_29]
MNWLRAHPYVDALAATLALLLVGALIVNSRSAASPAASTRTWAGTEISLFNPSSHTPPAPASTQPSQNQYSVFPNVLTVPSAYTPPVVKDPDTEQSAPFDFNAFIALLSAQGRPASGGARGTDNQVTDAYAFIPSGLMSTTSVQQSRSATQQKLYDYGNDIGSYIRSFEEQNQGKAQTLKDQVEDRSDSNKAAAVGELARALKEVGQNLQGMDVVPSAMASAHQKLAKSYIAIGTNLALVPYAERDSDFIAAIQTYNASADTFTRNYVAVAELFGAYGVVFAQSDAGSVFTFTPMSP